MDPQALGGERVHYRLPGEDLGNVGEASNVKRSACSQTSYSLVLVPLDLCI